MSTHKPFVIAVDFDGTLCTNAWPNIGTPNWAVIKKLKELQKAGAHLVLWTCRCDEMLEAAKVACDAWGLIFTAYNENDPDLLAYFGTESRKIGADIYLDDKGMLPDTFCEF